MELGVDPFKYKGKFQGVERTVKPFRALRSRMKSPKKISVSQWAKQHRIVTGIDKQPGAWDEDILPHLNKIMDTVSLPYVREVYMCLPERGGKTQVMLNAMGWTIDQGSKSGNIFWLMPTEVEAKKAMGERIIPVLKARRPDGAPGRLAQYLSEYDDDTKMGTVRFKTGTRLFPAWSNSPASMASYFGKLNIADEIDKFEASTNEGTTALDLLRKRARDDKSRSKFIAASTPGRARKIYSMVMEDAEQTWEYRLKCPDCGEYVIQEGEHLIINSDTVCVACLSCGSLWGESKREEAYRTGGWICTRGAEITRPSTVGFHMTAFTLTMVPLNEIEQYWQRSLTGTYADKVAWANGYLVKDYEQDLSDRKEDAILALCDTRPAGDVHPDTDALIISIDTQDKGFWFTIRGWKYGQQMTSWLVRAGYVPSARFDDFSGLDKILFEDTYRDCNGLRYPIKYGIIDSQGHRTTEVYSWCKRTGIFASQGAKGRRKYPVTYNDIEYYPGTKKAIPGGLRLYSLDTHHHKDIIADKLQVDISDPGAFVLYSGYTRIQMALKDKHPDLPMQNGLIDYARHFCAEIINEKRMWENPKHRPEHLWDCEQMGVALAYYLRFDTMQSESEMPSPQQRKQPQQQSSTRSANNRPSWFNRR